MARLEIVRYQGKRLLENVLEAFDRAVLAIPPERLDFKPTSENMSAKEISYHVYQGLYALFRGAATGELSEEDFQEIPFDPEAATKPEDIVAYGRRVKAYAARALVGLKEEDLDRRVRFFFGGESTGFEALEAAYTEALHHRGQLQIYLRLLGIAPPLIY